MNRAAVHGCAYPPDCRRSCRRHRRGRRGCITLGKSRRGARHDHRHNHHSGDDQHRRRRRKLAENAHCGPPSQSERPPWAAFPIVIVGRSWVSTSHTIELSVVRYPAATDGGTAISFSNAGSRVTALSLDFHHDRDQVLCGYGQDAQPESFGFVGRGVGGQGESALLGPAGRRPAWRWLPRSGWDRSWKGRLRRPVSLPVRSSTRAWLRWRSSRSICGPCSAALGLRA